MADLFDEMTIGNMMARNRAVRAATAESLATSAGQPTPQLMDLYAELAEGGVGTIITGFAFVTPDGKPAEGALGICDDAFAQDYRAMTRLVHERGARIVLQLVYGGSKSKLAAGDPRKLPACNAESQAPVPNARIMGPSAVENPRTHIVPQPATPEQLTALTLAFGAAARRAQAFGFDGVEVHVAHGYLLSQFLDRRFNLRSDEYGGSLHGRARLAIECVAAARTAVGPDFPVLVKINSCDVLSDPQGEGGGLGEDESAQVAAWLVEAGANAIEVSGDWHAASSHKAGNSPFFAAFGARLAAALDAPVIVTGGWRRPDVIAEHLRDDGIVGIGMSRPLICEPGIVNRWQSGNLMPSGCMTCGYCQRKPGIPCVYR